MTKSTRYLSVVFSGYYGMDNFGDDLFAFVCASAAKIFWQQTETRLLSPSIPGLEATFAIPELVSKKLYAKATAAGGLTRLMFAVREACRNNLFILGGGSVISSQTSGVRKLLYKSSGLTGISFAAMGISIGPFKSFDERERARAFLSEFLCVSVRDEASYQIAREFKLPCPVVQAGDLAGLMPSLLPAEQQDNKADGPVIGLALCPYESIVGGDTELESDRNQALITAVIKLAKRMGAKVEVFSLNNHLSCGDDLLAQKACTKLEQSGVNCSLIRNVDYGVAGVWRRIGLCDLFVSVRLHGAVAAYLNQVPFVLVEYHKKCTDFLDDIGQCNSLRIVGSVSDAGTISEVIARIAENPKKPLLSVEQYTERALLHFSSVPDHQFS
jgi:polysaccharide pyruvyl transferase WcaK-like protein